MTNLAKPCRRHNWPRSGARKTTHALPRFFLLTDDQRLLDPIPLLPNLPPGSAVILRSASLSQLTEMARRVIPTAHRHDIKVLLSSNARLAQRLGADGIHVPEQLARRGPVRPHIQKPGFLITAAAHSRLALYRAQQAGAHMVLLSPIFPTQSHQNTRPLGIVRFQLLAQHSALPVIALGGVQAGHIRHLKKLQVTGFAAIGAWR